MLWLIMYLTKSIEHFEKYDKLGFMNEPQLTPYKNLGPVIWFWSIFKHIINKQTNSNLDID